MGHNWIQLVQPRRCCLRAPVGRRRLLLELLQRRLLVAHVLPRARAAPPGLGGSGGSGGTGSWSLPARRRCDCFFGTTHFVCGFIHAELFHAGLVGLDARLSLLFVRRELGRTRTSSSRCQGRGSSVCSACSFAVTRRWVLKHKLWWRATSPHGCPQKKGKEGRGERGGSMIAQAALPSC
jgi:hypothetical protein